MKYILSIIIPIYNVEQYIEECLDSIFLQLPNEVEIILINDGTPDRSVGIIKSKYANWLAKDQVILLEQKNAGPGAARNRGLDVARGKYIGFLDSDDVLLDDYFTTLLDLIKKRNFDIIEFGFTRFHDISDIANSRYKSFYSFRGMHEINEVRNKIFSKGVWFPWTRVYKNTLFENIRFPEGVFYEDAMTIPFIYLKELSAFFVDYPLIGYRYNPNSTTALHSKSHAVDMYKYYLSLREFEHTVPIDILKIRLARSIVYFYNELKLSTIPIVDVLSDIGQIKKRIDIVANLQYPDLLFFLLPKVYMFIDKARLIK